MKENLAEKYGRWALVTGASSGIGADFGRQLAERGMNLILVARRKHRLDALAEEVRERNGVRSLVIPQDLTEPDASDNIMKAVGDREVGILVNNAGFGMAGFFHDLDPERQLNMVKLNCLAPVALTQAFLPAMLDRGKGALLFVSSVVAFIPTPFFGTYAATKAFDLMLGESLWAEYAKRGIDVLVLSPGSTATEFAEVAGTGGTKHPFIAESPDVVSTALKHLGRTPSVVHALPNRFFVLLSRIIPHKIFLRGTARVVRKMRHP